VNTPESRPADGDARTIHVRLSDVAQFFDPMDPSPFGEKDLDPKAEEYILESARELPGAEPCRIQVHSDQPPRRPDAETLLRDAIAAHFERRAHVLRLKRLALLREGLISLAIATVFVSALFALGQVLHEYLGDRGWPFLLREGLVIVGWVAMWRPIEIFLYGWWPILGDERLCRRLARVEVNVVSRAP
jgi:hypothetical protein